MLGKLAYRNTKRNIKDYMIYLITVTVSFSLICKLCLNGMPVPLLRNCYSIFNGTKYR